MLGSKCWLVAAVVSWVGLGAAVAADPDPVAAIRAVGREGDGNEAAAAGWKALATQGTAGVFKALEAFDDAYPTANNWLRAAVDAAVEAEKKAGRKLPADRLTAFVKDPVRNPAARRVAFELLAADDQAAADALLPTMIDDPSLEIRRDAIAARLKAAEKASDKEAEYKALFAAARDKDQVEELAKRLKDKVSITEHFGFVTRFHVVGPFDSPGGAGFATEYAPEKGADLAASYDGKGGAKATWKVASADDKYGSVDLNKPLGKLKDAVGYALTVVESPKDTACEIRVGSANAVRIYLNGTRLFEREEYHHGMVMDQHTGKGLLKAGRNEILVKVCQNAQPQPYAEVWAFQLRVCDATGGALPIKVVSPAAGDKGGAK